MKNHIPLSGLTAKTRRFPETSGARGQGLRERRPTWRHALALLLPGFALAAFACEVAPEEPSGEVVSAAIAPDLGTADSFAVLAGSAVTNTGPSVISGSLGVSPDMAVSGFPPGIVINGTIEQGTAVAAQAQADTTEAYNELAGQACDTDLTGEDLGGLTLVAGTYCFSSSAQLTGDLTLDAQGDPEAVFVFQIGSTLTTASAASVNVINGGNGCNVFWQVGSSATLGTATDFVGTIIALTSITLTTGVDVTGRVLARNGAVTLDTNTVTMVECESEPGTGGAGGASNGAGGASNGAGGASNGAGGASNGAGGATATTTGAGGATTTTTGAGGATTTTAGAGGATTTTTGAGAGGGTTTSGAGGYGGGKDDCEEETQKPCKEDDTKCRKCWGW